MRIVDLLEEIRMDWPKGACSLYQEIEDYSGVCGRCGWSVEDHEYLQPANDGSCRVCGNQT